MTTATDELPPLNFDALPDLKLEQSAIPRQQKISLLLAAYQFLWAVAFLVALGLLASTLVNYGMAGWRALQSMMPEGGLGLAGQGPGGDTLNVRLIQIWVIVGMAGALILSIAAVLMRFVMSQTRQLIEAPRTRWRINPPISVLLNDDKGNPSENYTIEVELEVFSDSRDVLIGPSMDNLRLSMSELVKQLTDETFRQLSQHDIERHFMVLCRQAFGQGVVTKVKIIGTDRRPVEASANGALDIPAPPTNRPPATTPEKEARDLAEVTAMHEQMRLARERALQESAGQGPPLQATPGPEGQRG